MGRIKTIQEDQLKSMKLVDTTPRIIRGCDNLEFYCHSCKITGNRRLDNARKSFKENGFYYQCEKCLKDKFKNRSEKWLENVRKACQTKEKKKTAIENSIKRMVHKKLNSVYDYWDFGDIDIQHIQGRTSVEGSCKKCNDISIKPIKRFIENAKDKVSGCGNCWLTYTQSTEYSNIMQDRAVNVNPESRVLQGLKLSEYLNNRSDEDIAKMSNKTKQTNLKKYGFENPMQSPKVREKTQATLASNNYQSSGEKELNDWIQSLGITTEKSYFGGNKPGEIDILIREKKLAIEYNGDYFHSEARSGNSTTHLHKTQQVRIQKDCQLIHIFDSEWQKFPERVKAFLSGHLIKGTPIRASKCEIREIDNNIAYDFCNLYHLQGKPNGSIVNLGLFFNQELLSVMTFSKPHRQNMGSEPHLSRYVIKPGYRIHGGLSRMSKHAHSKIGDFITYVHLRLSSGDSYIKSGYTKISDVKPDYWYWDIKKNKVIGKQSRRKSAVNTPSILTEKEHAKLDGLYRVWDCGKIKLKFTV